MISSKTIASFNNRHCGERAWIVGNGPSAEQWMMEELRSLGGVVMGTNRCWRKSPRTGATFQDTDYHTFVAGHHFDDTMAGHVLTDTAFIPARYSKFMGTRWQLSRRRFKGNIIFIPTIDAWKSQYGKPFHFHFERGGCVANFAGQLAIALCAFMGFSEMLLLGFDANDCEGHFFDDDTNKGKPPGFSRKPMRQWFDSIAEWARVDGRTTIINCSATSAIDQLPRMPKEEVLKWLRS